MPENQGTKSTWSNIGQGLVSAIPYVGPMIANLWQGAQERRNVQQNQATQNAANLKLAEYQYSKDLEMWNRQNKYNTPEMQMQRYKDAGLNPNLIYGQGSPGLASQLPKYQAPTVEYSPPVAMNVPAMLSDYMDFRLKSAQIKNAELQQPLLSVKEQLGYMDLSRKEFDNMLKRVIATGEYSGKYGGFMEDTLQGYAASQRGYVSERNRKIMADIKNAEANTTLTLKRADWFAAQAIGRMLTDGLGAVSKLIPSGRIGRASGALSGGTLKNEKRLRALEMGSYYGSQRFK